MKAVLDLPEAHNKALGFLLSFVPPVEILWVLTGSAGMRLQGVDVKVNDLDVQTTSAGVIEMAGRLEEANLEGARLRESERMRSTFARIDLFGVQVELMGDIQHRQEDGTWSPAINLVDVRRWVDWKGQQVPVLDLRHEEEAYRRMGRTAKAEAIHDILQAMRGHFHE
jgi:hypothetical protein